MPTAFKPRKAILDLIKDPIFENLQGDISELGSGFLTLALPIAKKFPENTVLAYETSTVPYWYSKLLVSFLKQNNLKILKHDFFQSNLSESALIVCYLYPAAMEKLKIKFETELKKGTLVISNTFAIPGWKPIITVTVNDLYQTKIYLYKY